MSRRETLEEFIEKSRKVHGCKYDYSLVSLNGNQAKVDIICPVHGIFHQSPGHHKTGKGCRKCGDIKRALDSKELYSDFVSFVKSLHESKYEYEESSVDGYRQLKLNLKCASHGWFQMNSTCHKLGKGCRKCSAENNSLVRRSSVEDFIQKARAVHGDVYIYELVKYVNSSTNVDILCRKHGLFPMAPGVHIHQKQGCPSCGIENHPMLQKDSLERLLSKFKAAHGDYYDYSLIESNPGDLVKVKIICPDHGIFEQAPGAHKVGKGCSSCGVSGYDQNKPGTFYILITENLTKVGITNRKVHDRIRSINRTSGEVFVTHTYIKSEDGAFIYTTEQRVLGWLKSTYENVGRKFDGYTECFIDVDIDKLLEFIAN